MFVQNPDEQILGVHNVDSVLRTADLVVLRPQNAEWTVNVIGLLNPWHAIFSKNYLAPKPVVNRISNSFNYDNGDEFFDDLPDLTPH